MAGLPTQADPWAGVLQSISRMKASPVDVRAAMTSNPNEVNPGPGSGGLGQNIAWGNVPGLESFYSYDAQNNAENFDIQSALPEMERLGYTVMQGSDPGSEAMGGWVVGPDGKPIAQSARLTGTNDDRFKLAALAAMGVTGANIAGAGGMFGGGGNALQGGGYMEAAGINEAATAGLGDWGAASGGLLDSLGSALGGAGKTGGSMGWFDYLNAGLSIYGMVQNEKAIDKAGDASDRALDLAGAAANRQADLAETTYKNYLEKIQPGMLEDAEFARERARIVAGQGDTLYETQLDDADFYRDRWRGTQVPLEDEIIAEARKLGTPEEADRLAGLATADTRAAFSDMRAMSARDSARQGLNPGSAAARALAQDAFMSEALASAGNASTVRIGAKDRYRAGLTDAAALGRGLPGFSSSASGGAAQGGGLQLQAGALPASASTSVNNSNTAALAGTSNMWGNSANTMVNAANGVNNYANTVNNSAMSTLAGYGWSNWMKPPQPQRTQPGG